MAKRYSDMSHAELRAEIATLHEQAQKAEQLGIVNEVHVLKRKMVMAEAYMVDISEFQAGKTYEIKEEPGERFTIEYFKGIFAWGYKGERDELTAYPVSLLRKK